MVYLYLDSDPICFLFKSLCLLSTFQSRKGTSTAPHLPNPTHHLTYLPPQARYSLLFLSCLHTVLTKLHFITILGGSLLPSKKYITHRSSVHDFNHAFPQAQNVFLHQPTWKMIFSGFKSWHKHYLISAAFCNSLFIPNPLILFRKNCFLIRPPIV